MSDALPDTSGDRPAKADTAPDSTAASAVPPSRKGKNVITGYFDPTVSKQLKQLAMEHGTTAQALLAEALHLLSIERVVSAIARSDKG